jgi:RHH-type transcriptional regulator, proline utilization regulon repressor / proline dehydrogenase / delta 1-pyrroline-5-carboxylate dehydrogenase
MGERPLAPMVIGRPTARTCPAASTRRSAATRTCCPTWCAACWRTAPTPASSTASPTSAISPVESLVADPVRNRGRFASIPHPAHPAAGRPLPHGPTKEELHGHQPRQRQRRCARWPNHRRAPRALARRAAGAGRAQPAGAWVAVTARPTAASGRHWQAADAATVERALANAVAAQPAGTRCRRPRAPRSSSTPPTCWSSACREFIALCTREAGKTWPTASPRCARRSTSCATTPPGARAVRPAEPLPGADRRVDTPAAARARRVRLHQPVELPAGDLHRPGGRRAGRRQRVIAKPAEQTTLIAMPRCKLLHEAGVPEAVLQLRARRRRHGRRAADPRSARRRRRLHRLDRDRAPINRALAARDARSAC